MCRRGTNPYESPKTNGATGDISERPTVQLSGCLTVANFFAAHRLNTRGYWPRLVLGLGVLGTFSIFLVAISVSSRPYSPQASNTLLMVACLLIPLLLGVPLLWRRLRLHHYASKRYGAFAHLELVFSFSGVASTTANSKTEYEWDAFSGYRSGDSVMLMYFANSDQSLIVARDMLRDPGQWLNLYELIESRLPRT